VGADFWCGLDAIEDDKAMAASRRAPGANLAAWDPVAQKEVWRVQLRAPLERRRAGYAGDLRVRRKWRGRDLCLQGRHGLEALTGATQAGVLAAPMTYEVNGEQYIAIEVGYGGAFALAAGPLALDAHVKGNSPRVLAFQAQRQIVLPARAPEVPRVLQPPPNTRTLLL